MFHASRACAIVLLAMSLGGCQALSGAGGVMPDNEIGPPPSERAALPNKQFRGGAVDDDGQPIATAQSRQLALPSNVRGGGRSDDGENRRIRREDLAGGNADPRNTGGRTGTMGPSMMPSGNMGMGGRF